jgi:hypothetical protein
MVGVAVSCGRTNWGAGATDYRKPGEVREKASSRGAFGSTTKPRDNAPRGSAPFGIETGARDDARQLIPDERQRPTPTPKVSIASKPAHLHTGFPAATLKCLYGCTLRRK